MGGAVNIVDAGSEAPGVRKERLSVSKNRGLGRRSDFSVKIVVRHNFNQVRAAIGEHDCERQNFVLSVRASPLRSRGTDRYAAHHAVVDILLGASADQTGEFLIHFGRAALRYRHILSSAGG